MLLTAVIFILILSVLVFIHELGHYSIARIIGVKVEEFGLGLPPRAWGKKIGNTIYSLNWLPIGGFVKLAGEDEEEELAQKEHHIPKAHIKEYFWARSKKERSAILVAGVTMNFLLAVCITSVLLLYGVKEPSGRVTVETVQDGSPAALAGLHPGDLVKTVTAPTNDMKKIRTPSDLISYVGLHKGESVVLTIDRQGEIKELHLVPRKDPPPGQGPMGVSVTDLEIRRYSLLEAPVMAFKINIERAYLMIVGIVDTIKKLVTMQAATADVAGPIGIAQVTGQAVKFGWRAVLEFMSILSLNLAILNILPIPALDGGRLAFIFAEKLLGRKVKPAFEKSAHQIGMIILFILILLVSFNDIMRLTHG